jgi:hypothetical protein
MGCCNEITWCNDGPGDGSCGDGSSRIDYDHNWRLIKIAEENPKVFSNVAWDGGVLD